MKRKITWFVIGFVASWLTWSTINIIRFRPRDYTQSWSQYDKEYAPAWLKTAKGLKLGSVIIFTPSTKSPACVLLQPQKPRKFPQIMIEDENADGKPNSFFVSDRLHRYLLIQDEDGDGSFDSVTFSTGTGTNSVSISDHNMDGIPDIRLGPGQSIAVTIDGVWHDLIHTNKTQYVEINGILSPVKTVGGTWKVIEGKNQQDQSEMLGMGRLGRSCEYPSMKPERMFTSP